MNTIEIPVLLLTGYLGSGKTTLVNHILSNKRGIKFAVIVNDDGLLSLTSAKVSDLCDNGLEKRQIFVSSILSKQKKGEKL